MGAPWTYIGEIDGEPQFVQQTFPEPTNKSTPSSAESCERVAEDAFNAPKGPKGKLREAQEPQPPSTRGKLGNLVAILRAQSAKEKSTGIKSSDFSLPPHNQAGGSSSRNAADEIAGMDIDEAHATNAVRESRQYASVAPRHPSVQAQPVRSEFPEPEPAIKVEEDDSEDIANTLCTMSIAEQARNSAPKEQGPLPAAHKSSQSESSDDKLDRVLNSLESFQAQVVENFASLDTRVKTLESKIEQTSKDIKKSISTKFAKQEKSWLEKVAESVKSIKATTESLEQSVGRLEEVGRSPDRAPGRVQSSGDVRLDRLRTSVVERLGRTERTVDKVAAGLDKMAVGLDQLMGTQVAINTGLDQLTGMQTTVNAGLGQLTTTIAASHQANTTNMANLERLTNQTGAALATAGTEMESLAERLHAHTITINKEAATLLIEGSASHASSYASNQMLQLVGQQQDATHSKVVDTFNSLGSTMQTTVANAVTQAAGPAINPQLIAVLNDPAVQQLIGNAIKDAATPVVQAQLADSLNNATFQ